MNRIFLVGNGYDLATGLKTSYEDFLLDFFKSRIIKFATSFQDYNDEIIHIKYNGIQMNMDILKPKLEKINSIQLLLSNHLIRFTHSHSYQDWINESYVLNDSKDYFPITIKSQFLRQILGDYNWRDIESFYFENLLKIFEKELALPNKSISTQEKSKLKNAIQESLLRLNREFENLKQELIKYLTSISNEIHSANTAKPLKPFKNMLENLEENTFNRFFNNDIKSETEKELNKVLIVNFNYTPTLGVHSLYSSEEQKEKYTVIHIHGEYNKPEDIIFGYGDDSHPSYQKLELHGNDEYLKNIKSFYYPFSSSYIELMNFIESDQFEIQIVGHSLGLSDRVLLKSIFENNNCKCIRLYHRGNKNKMIHKYMALSRHFNDKQKMRRKILEYDFDDVFS